MNTDLDPIDKKIAKVGSVEDQAQEAFKKFQYLKKILYMQGAIFLEVGGILCDIQERKLYSYLGHPTFVSFINDSDIGISFKTAYSWIRIYKTYIKKFGFQREEIAGVPWYKLEIIMGNINVGGKEEAMELIEKAKALSPQDLYTEIRSIRDKDEQYDDVALKYFPPPHMRKHKRCGKWILEVDPESVCKCPDMKSYRLDI